MLAMGRLRELTWAGCSQFRTGRENEAPSPSGVMRLGVHCRDLPCAYRHFIVAVSYRLVDPAADGPRPAARRTLFGCRAAILRSAMAGPSGWLTLGFGADCGIAMLIGLRRTQLRAPVGLPTRAAEDDVALVADGAGAAVAISSVRHGAAGTSARPGGATTASAWEGGSVTVRRV